MNRTKKTNAIVLMIGLYVVLVLGILAFTGKAHGAAIDTFVAPAAVAEKTVNLPQKDCVQTGGQLVCTGSYHLVPTMTWPAAATANVTKSGAFCQTKVVAASGPGVSAGQPLGTSFTTASGAKTVNFGLPSAGTYQVYGLIVCNDGSIAQTSPPVTVTANPPAP